MRVDDPGANSTGNENNSTLDARTYGGGVPVGFARQRFSSEPRKRRSGWGYYQCPDLCALVSRVGGGCGSYRRFGRMDRRTAGDLDRRWFGCNKHFVAVVSSTSLSVSQFVPGRATRYVFGRDKEPRIYGYSYKRSGPPILRDRRSASLFRPTYRPTVSRGSPTKFGRAF